MCRLLKVSKSGVYAWVERPMSPRARADIALTAKIHEFHRRSRGARQVTYVPIDGTAADVLDLNVKTSRKLVIHPGDYLLNLLYYLGADSVTGQNQNFSRSDHSSMLTVLFESDRTGTTV